MATLEITTLIGCPNNCPYCPQDLLIRAYQGNILMTLEQFRKILDNTPMNVQIDFTGFSEPFYNPASAWMMRYSIEHGYRTVLYTTLKGFSQQDADVLRGLHFNDLVFHIYKGIDKEEFERNKLLFEAYVHPPNRIAILNPENGYVNTAIWSRAGNVFGTMPKDGKFQCAFAGKLFDHNVVLPNGDVYLCCQDYALKHKIGNLYTQSYNSLDRGSIVELSNQEQNECICRRCEICQFLDK